MKKDEYNYFDEFIENATYIVKTAEILKETLNNYEKNILNENINNVHKLENLTDNKLHNMREYLIKDFLPPIDREDIILIGHRLDDIEDFLDEILLNFSILNITKIKDDIYEFLDLLLNCCKKVKEAFINFKNMKKYNKVKEKIVEVNNIEEQGDKMFEKIMKKLYEEEKSPIEIIKWTTIYNCIENTIDTCERVCDELENVIVKNM